MKNQTTMPTRTPIIPNGNNNMLLRGMHCDIANKTVDKNLSRSTTSSSGIHSNSDESEDSIPPVTSTKKSKHRRDKATKSTLDNSKSRDKHALKQNGSDESDNNADTIDQSVSSMVSWKKEQAAAESSQIKNSDVTKRKESKHDTSKSHPCNLREDDQVIGKDCKQYQLQQRCKQSNDGTQITGTSFAAKIAEFGEKFRKLPPRPSFAKAPTVSSALDKREKGSKVKSDESDSLDMFPLEGMALGEQELIDVKKIKQFQKSAKQEAKMEKRAIAVAKLDVSKAKLSEFEITLRARQARIDEQHAKLCQRRAVIKRAEERLDMIEARLDDEEESHRERERRVKNRERRVRQEEVGIKIKEASLKKREDKIKDDIESIETRRKLVEEKEMMLSTMNDIMSKREALHGKNTHISKGKRAAAAFEKIFHGKQSTSRERENVLREQSNNVESQRSQEKTTSSASNTSHPVPIPRKSVAVHQSPPHSKLNNDVIVDGKQKHNSDGCSSYKHSSETSSRNKTNGDAVIVGLWL